MKAAIELVRKATRKIFERIGLSHRPDAMPHWNPLFARNQESSAFPQVSESTKGTSIATPGPACKSSESKEFLDLLLALVDIHDEIGLMKSSAAPDLEKTLSHIQGRLRDRIELAHGELICEASWDPSIQRAVKMETAPPNETETRVLKSISTGLRLNGKLIRKQEVEISKA